MQIDPVRNTEHPEIIFIIIIKPFINPLFVYPSLHIFLNMYLCLSLYPPFFLCQFTLYFKMRIISISHSLPHLLPILSRWITLPSGCFAIGISSFVWYTFIGHSDLGALVYEHSPISIYQGYIFRPPSKILPCFCGHKGILTYCV